MTSVSGATVTWCPMPDVSPAGRLSGLGSVAKTRSADRQLCKLHNEGICGTNLSNWLMMPVRWWQGGSTHHGPANRRGADRWRLLHTVNACFLNPSHSWARVCRVPREIMHLLGRRYARHHGHWHTYNRLVSITNTIYLDLSTLALLAALLILNYFNF